MQQPFARFVKLDLGLVKKENTETRPIDSLSPFHVPQTLQEFEPELCGMSRQGQSMLAVDQSNPRTRRSVQHHGSTPRLPAVSTGSIPLVANRRGHSTRVGSPARCCLMCTLAWIALTSGRLIWQTAVAVAPAARPRVVRREVSPWRSGPHRPATRCYHCLGHRDGGATFLLALRRRVNSTG